MRFQVCTIAARNYLAHARVLYRSFRQFHPDSPFTVLVFDAPSGSVTGEEFDVLSLTEIGLSPGEETRMPLLYNVTELATALKPWFFRTLVQRNATELLYFDPDIEIFTPVERLAELARAHCLVLTPHTTRPMSREDVRPNETDILSAGAYNLGFLGLNRACDSFLDWWSERLLREAFIDVANMRFTDQRWMDFAPGYFDSCILKDETCNVAYWNADSRGLSWTGQRYEVRGEPLCFFHFSGFKPEVPHLLSAHQGHNPRTRLSEHPAVAKICREYSEKLTAAGYEKLRTIGYGFARTPRGLEITPAMRQAYRTALREHEESDEPAPPNVFADENEFVAWLNEPLYPRVCPEITRYAWSVHQLRPDLRKAFPNLLGVDNAAYYEWFVSHGRYDMKIPNELLPRRPLTGDAAETSRNGSSSQARGVTLVGYLRAEVGTGEAGRLMTAALRESGEQYSTYLCSATTSRQMHPWNEESLARAPSFDTNLICMNADQLPAFAQEVGPQFFQGCYNIGLWFWEAEVFPPPMHAAFDYVHEIWVASDFSREAIGRVARVPVVTIPLPLNIDAPLQRPTRAELGLPDGFLFLFTFDFLSVPERKNPVAVIEAFKRAFQPGEGPTLLLKSINGERNRAQLEKLHYARADRADIVIRDEYVSAEERHDITAACDCYVSLHRSEGFGLTMAEAMLLEKPVIATNYSGNLAFMNEGNSFLCDFTMRRIGFGNDPYPPDARWAEPDLAQAAKLMRFVYENPEEARRRGENARRDLCARHSPAVAGAFMRERFAALRQNPPTPVAVPTTMADRAALAKVRAFIQQGVNVRQTVPSLLTWIAQGPRRAMKQFLRRYEQHQQRVALATLDAFREIDAQSLSERAALSERLREQETELQRLREALQEAQTRLAALEDSERQPGSQGHPRSHISSG